MKFETKKLNTNGITIFLPIRKGSKRIKNKNIKSLPDLRFGLTELKINQLKKLRTIYRKSYNKNIDVLISTDCMKVFNFCKKFSWLKVLKRKKKLSTDDSLSKLIEYVPNICHNKYILWTHVTSPKFNERDYLNFIKQFFKIRKKNPASKSAFSADLIQKFMLDNDGKWVSHNYIKKKWPRTQDLKPIYVINSAAFLSLRDIYTKERDRLCKKPSPIISRRNSGFDIDTFEDFMELKNELNIKKFKFKKN
jgi:CMP-N-acetylneuraminic acid synthetase